MQISLSPEEHRRVKAAAAARGISTAEYVRRRLAEAAGAEPEGNVEAIVALGDSGRDDLSSTLDERAAEAAAELYR